MARVKISTGLDANLSATTATDRGWLRHITDTGKLACTKGDGTTFKADLNPSASPYADAVLYYTFDNVSGSTIIDEKGTYDGIATGVTYSTGVDGNGADFNGSADILTTGNLISTEITFAFWAKSTSTAREVFFALTSSTTVIEIVLENNGFGSSNGFTAYLAGSDTILNNGDALQDGQWHHIALVLSSTSTILYKDGVQIGTTANVHDGTETGLNLLIGKRNLSTTLSYNGSIDDFSVFPYALTQDEINTLAGV